MINILLITTTSIHISAHFCKGELYSFSLFGKAEKCAMANESNTSEMAKGHSCCQRKEKEHEKQGNCCDDKEIIIYGLQVDSELVKSSEVISLATEHLDALITSSILNSSSFSYIETLEDPGYPPPPRVAFKHDILNLYQVFRI